MNVLSSRTLSQKRILIAEDSDVVRWTISALLENDGVPDVVATPNFYGAMDFVVSDGPFDLVLLDYHMPGMHGLSGLRRMIAANELKPVALISGRIAYEKAEQAIAEGAVGFVPKILAPRLIAQAIRAMADGKTFAADHFLKQSS